MKPQRRSVYIFHRVGGWYPLELSGNKEARANAERNPGTLRVTTHDGRVIWKKHSQ